AVQLSLLRQPALSQVSRPTNRALAGKATATPLALCLLLFDVHLAGPSAPAGLCPSEKALRTPVPERRRRLTEAGLGPAVCRRPTRRPRCCTPGDATCWITLMSMCWPARADLPATASNGCMPKILPALFRATR